jgi:hypothetical protein
MAFKRLGMAFFTRPRLLLSCRRPSLRPAGKERSGYHEAVAMQAATWAAALGGGELIRKMRPFEEPRASPLIVRQLKEGHGVLFSKAVYADMTHETRRKHGFEGFSE